MQTMQSLDKLNRFIDCDWFLKNKINIDKYYKINAFSYRMFYSKEGFMHMSISTKNKDMDGLSYQPKTVEAYITEKTTSILELGCGWGANISYLASKYPKVNFIGIDLYPKLRKKLKNVDIMKNDYTNLFMIPDASMDIVYAFETICYCDNKKKLFREIKRILKPNGKFIIFDRYAIIPDIQLDQSEEKIKKLIESCMAIDNLEYYENIEDYARTNGFGVVLIKDLSENVIPNMHRFKMMIDKYMNKGFLFKFLCKVLPKAFIGKAISGYLMEDTFKENIFGYYEHIFIKK